MVDGLIVWTLLQAARSRSDAPDGAWTERRLGAPPSPPSPAGPGKSSPGLFDSACDNPLAIHQHTQHVCRRSRRYCVSSRPRNSPGMARSGQEGQTTGTTSTSASSDSHAADTQQRHQPDHFTSPLLSRSRCMAGCYTQEYGHVGSSA
jgi:hypothetical protein